MDWDSVTRELEDREMEIDQFREQTNESLARLDQRVSSQRRRIEKLEGRLEKVELVLDLPKR